MVSISLNGAPYVCRSASPRISDLVRDLSLEGKRIAIERNGEIVPRSKHAETLLAMGIKSRSSPPLAAARIPEDERSQRNCRPGPRRPAGHRRSAYRSRLLVGTGKYKDFAETPAAIDASGAEIVTVAIRRTNIGQNANEPSLLDYLPPSQFTLSAEHRGLLHGGRRGAHAQARTRAARRPQAGEARSAGRPAHALSERAGDHRAAEDADQGRLRRHGVHAPTTRSSRASSKPSAASRSCRWRR